MAKNYSNNNQNSTNNGMNANNMKNGGASGFPPGLCDAQEHNGAVPVITYLIADCGVINSCLCIPDCIFLPTSSRFVRSV